MGHDDWTKPLSKALEEQLIRKLVDGASSLQAITLAIASVAALALF